MEIRKTFAKLWGAGKARGESGESVGAPLPAAAPSQPGLPGGLTHRLVATQAARNPDGIALATDTGKVTYGELEHRAGKLANHLLSLGAGPEIPIGLCMERSPEFVIAAYAIMKCGAAYLPMDPAYPQERLEFIAKDAAVPVIVTVQKLAGNFSDCHAKIVAVDAEQASIDANPAQFADGEQTADSLAYVIYTSGSTGKPKGVEVTHLNLANLVAWHARAFGVGASERATFQAGVGFDAAVWEIWPYLAAGSSVYVPDEATRISAEALRDWLVLRQITISFAPTAMAEQLIALAWPARTALRFLLTGADSLQRFPAPGLPFSLVNNYGPTECAVVATSGVVAPGANGGVPSIGRAIDGVSIHILDEELREAGAGVTGEIYIGGAGVARGYRNRPDLTAERFIADPFSTSGGRLYRTGDMARRTPNGEIMFAGRIDDQVKIRGYRIELNEINAALNEHPSVQASVVVAREEAPGGKRLVAYVVPAPGSQGDEKSVRELLRRRLPDYMAPSAFVWIDALPLTANGKVDRAALPPPDSEDRGGYVAPATPLEQSMAKIIAEVLGVPRVSMDDDFFALGGHSLLGAQVVARVREVFGAELQLLDVFDAPTVAELSEKVEEVITSQLDSMTDEEVAAALGALNAVPAGNASTR